MNKKLCFFTAFMIIFCALVLQLVNSNIVQPAAVCGAFADSRRVYLTFDDGPSDRVTPKILDTLESEGVAATFFIVGRSAERRENIVRRAFAEGHSIGVHSYSHEYGSIYSSPRALLDDIQKCNELIYNITGKLSHIYRFPGGSFNIDRQLVSAVTGAGYRYIDWNASCRDAEIWSPSPEQLLNAVKTTSADKNTIVLLCHDSTDKTATALALKDIICYYRHSGYEFCTF